MNKKRFKEAFPEVSDQNVNLCFQLMYGSEFPPDEELPERTQKWLRQCYNRPSQPELALHAIDATLDGFGVEAIYSEEPFDRYHYDVRACYSNQGDVYNATVLRDNRTNRWWLTTVGDYAASVKGLR